MLILNRNHILVGVLLSGLAITSIVFLNIQLFFLSSILSFLFLISAPGIILMLALKIRGIGFWENLVYTLGLSISFLMFGGLAVNWILPLVKITDKPLSLLPLTICFGLILFIFGTLAYVRNKDLKLEIKIPNFSTTSKLFLTIPIIFPILSILGAISLNNGGSNYLSLLMIGSIAVYVMLIIFLRNNIDVNVYPWAILLISISLLFSYSLRSWNVSGWDIAQELYVLELTKSKLFWNIDSFRNAYNSCLSITLLPSVLSIYSNINNQYIFKLIFPLLFSSVPLSIYLISKKYINSWMAFLASFFFMSQWMFSNGYPAINREMIGLIFLALMLHLIFTKKLLNNKYKQILFLILGVSVVVSHYSLAYFSIFMFLVVYLFTFILKIFQNKFNLLINFKISFDIKFLVLLILVIFTFLWNFQIANTTINLTKVISSYSFTLNNIPFLEAQSFSYSNLLSQYNSQPKNLNENGIDSPNYYNKTKTNKYAIEPIYNNYQLPQNQTAWTSASYLFKIITISSLIFLFIGFLYLVYKLKSDKEAVDYEYLIISSLYLFLIVFSLFSPDSENFISPLRIYQQGLILLSLIYVVGSMVFLKIIKLGSKKGLVAIIFVLYFLFYTTFLQVIIGGAPFTADTFSFKNSGIYYQFYYTHDSEIKSAEWISRERNLTSSIYADEIAALRLLPFGHIKDVNYRVLPNSIEKDSYVYLDYRNTNIEMAYARYLGKFNLKYNYPNEFLSENKNLIYNNGESEIYK